MRKRRWEAKVVSEEDNIILALPSAKVNKAEDAVEERLTKMSKLQPVTTSKLIDQQAKLQVRGPILTKRRSANVHAFSKMKARRPQIVEEDNTDCSETTSLCRISLEE